MGIIRYNYLGRKMIGGGLDAENHRSLIFEEYYELDNVEDIPTFLAFLNPAGRIVHSFPCFRIQTSRVERITAPLANGSVTLTIAVTCTTNSDIMERDRNGSEVTENTPPWLYGLEKFKIVSAIQQENVTYIWPAADSDQPTDGLRLFRSEDKPLAMRNTAGVPIEATTSRGLAELSFIYNLQNINPDAPWLYVSKINKYPIKIAGIEFPKRTIQIRSITMDQVVERNNDASVRWEYYKVGVQFVIDPQTFNRDYLNTSLSIRRPEGLSRIWSWGDGKYFGSFANYIDSGFDDGEEMGEPMFLTESGTTLSPYDSEGKQIPVYLPGSVYEPIDFEILEFPEERYY